jgi:hypothetical protein
MAGKSENGKMAGKSGDFEVMVACSTDFEAMADS